MRFMNVCEFHTHTDRGAIFSSPPYPNTTNPTSYAALIAWVLFPQS